MRQIAVNGIKAGFTIDFSNFYLLFFHYRKVILGEMVFEMKLVEFSNPSNKTYTNKPCGIESDNQSSQCETGFLFCLVDLPFRNPQNCSLGDYTTPIFGGNRILFTPNSTQNPKTPLK